MILIKDGRLIDPGSGTDEVLDLVVEEGRVKYIGKFQRTEEYGEIIEARGKVVAPGLIDVHVHFRDPGFTHKEDIVTGAGAAARGGYTTVVCMANTKPVADTPETLKEILEKGAQTGIHVLTAASVTKGLAGKELSDFAALKEAGAVGFSDDGIPILDTGLLCRAMELAVELDVPISLHEEDPALIGMPGVNRGKVSGALGLPGAPSVSESSMVARDCMLALSTGARVNIQHISSRESVECVRFAKGLGARVWAEATPHHFSLTEEAVLEHGALAKMNPPLRGAEDRYSIVAGLTDGTIDIIATDHAPHTGKEKSQGLDKAPSGIIGLETALGLGVTNLVRKGHLTLSGLLEKMALGPARLYGLDAGHLTEGGPADIVIFDDKEHWEVEGFVSKSQNSPFLGQSLYGRVYYTICGGAVVYRRQ